MLKNKKFLGKVQEQYIRTKSKPLITEVSENNIEISSENIKASNEMPKISEVKEIKWDKFKYFL